MQPVNNSPLVKHAEFICPWLGGVLSADKQPTDHTEDWEELRVCNVVLTLLKCVTGHVYNVTKNCVK